MHRCANSCNVAAKKSPIQSLRFAVAQSTLSTVTTGHAPATPAPVAARQPAEQMKAVPLRVEFLRLSRCSNEFYLCNGVVIGAQTINDSVTATTGHLRLRTCICEYYRVGIWVGQHLTYIVADSSQNVCTSMKQRMPPASLESLRLL